MLAILRSIRREDMCRGPGGLCTGDANAMLDIGQFCSKWASLRPVGREKHRNVATFLLAFSMLMQ